MTKLNENESKTCIFIDRQHSADLAIVYPSRQMAHHALDHSVFIDGLCEDDALECYVPDASIDPKVIAVEMTSREVIIAPVDEDPCDCADCADGSIDQL